MPIKYLGAIMIFVSCSTFGFKMAADYRSEERCLAEFSRLLDNMQCELEYRLAPLPQICTNIAQEATGCLQKIFNILALELGSQNAPDATACMEVALSAVKEIPTRLQSALISLGNSLGKYDLQGQMNEIAAVKRQCTTDLEQMRDQQDVRLRSYRTLGLCVGAGLAILFL